MYIRKKANKHEGLCCIFTLREKLVIEKKKKRKNEDVPLSQERGSNLTKKKNEKNVYRHLVFE